MIRKKCEQCGKEFVTRNKRRKYCSKQCRITANENKCTVKGQLCWNCENATGKCSWSACFIPVEGWTAKATKIKECGQVINSYRISKCPQYIQGRTR